MNSFDYIHQDLGEKEFLFILSILSDAFELDANIANFVLCHGMTKSVRKTNRLTKMLIFTILASFVCFFNFPDRNLIILYKIT